MVISRKQQTHLKAIQKIGSQARNQKRAAKREWERRADSLRRKPGTLIPQDSVRAILHSVHKLQGPPQEEGEERMSEAAAVTRTADQLGYSRGTVHDAVKRWHDDGEGEISVKDGAGRGGGARGQLSVDNAQCEVAADAEWTCRCYRAEKGYS